MLRECPKLDFLKCNTALGECVDGCEIEKRDNRERQEEMKNKRAWYETGWWKGKN